MEYRFATDTDLDLLADWDLQLLRKQGHENTMTFPDLRDRMKECLDRDCKAVIFEYGGEPVAYALYRQTVAEVNLRHLFVIREHRRKGIGRKAVEILRDRVWPRNRRLTVEIPMENLPSVLFWRSLGYRDHALVLELPSEKTSRRPAAAAPAISVAGK